MSTDQVSLPTFHFLLPKRMPTSISFQHASHVRKNSASTVEWSFHSYTFDEFAGFYRWDAKKQAGRTPDALPSAERSAIFCTYVFCDLTRCVIVIFPPVVGRSASDIQWFDHNWVLDWIHNYNLNGNVRKVEYNLIYKKSLTALNTTGHSKHLKIWGRYHIWMPSAAFEFLTHLNF